MELICYFNDSFGSSMRIDYGTGHEMNFLILLLCLEKLGYYGPEDYESVVRNLFYGYMNLMRKIQDVYKLEPAGSKGAWGLDDYHFVPFIFGGAELEDHPAIKSPSDIHRDDILEAYGDDYMYLNCIRFIKKVKFAAPFHETSPLLNNISGAANWSKIANVRKYF